MVLPDDLTRLAKKYGTPLYVYDAQSITGQIEVLRQAVPRDFQLFYSLKANPNTTLVHEITKHGLYAEVSSLNELQLVTGIGVPPKCIMCIGPGKSFELIKEAMRLGIGYYIAESMDEIQHVEEWAARFGQVRKIGIRINPSLSIKGAKLSMGGVSRQFGIDEERLPEVLDLLKRKPHIQLSGIHVYYGTRILAADVIAQNTAYILQMASDIMSTVPLRLDYVGIGGGWGIPYYANETGLNLSELKQQLESSTYHFRKTAPNTEILMESGRFIVGTSGTYVARVVATKWSKGVKYVIVDGGTHHAHLTAGGGFRRGNFTLIPLVPSGRRTLEQIITGPLCTPEDIIADKIIVPELVPGDLIGIMNTGAYGLTASPVLFLSHSLPKEVLVAGDKDYLIRDRHEYMHPLLRMIDTGE